MTAELYAIRVALNHLNEEHITGAVLFTYSLSSCQLIEGAQPGERRNTMIQEIIKKATTLKVTVQWIPSHISIKGNEVADELAKAGINSNLILENGIFKKDALNIFNQRRIKNTNDWYTTCAEETGKHFFFIQPHFNDTPWYNNKEVRCINRLMAGHSCANNWLATMKIVEDSDCEVFLTIDTVDHVILLCNKYATTRSKYNFDGRF
ncbi:uncharacterized protein LOC134223069 [Armigeres subalbatus]|uniref:uncharacterized protein LOC134223069 n=1 Tax=Armigeres subalbatus TaxID=124917 RepID=UPI002ED29A50